MARSQTSLFAGITRSCVVGDYATRADHYLSEFNTRLDFDVVGGLLLSNHGPVLDIPCGAGRLLPLYAKLRVSDLCLVDIENAMVQVCRREAARLGFNSTCRVFQGDLRQWRMRSHFGLIVVPRGGLQMLGRMGEVRKAMANLQSGLSPGGLVYVDVHDPWSAFGEPSDTLPSFMRFTDRRSLSGVSEYHDGPVRITRRYESKLNEDSLDVQFEYTESPALGRARGRRTRASARWIRISRDELLCAAIDSGLEPVSVSGDYDGRAPDARSSRIIATFRRGKAVG